MIEKRVISKANLEAIKEIINKRFAEEKSNKETRDNILSDIEVHITDLTDN